jgi:hypothetical protein
MVKNSPVRYGQEPRVTCLPSSLATGTCDEDQQGIGGGCGVAEKIVSVIKNHSTV